MFVSFQKREVSLFVLTGGGWVVTSCSSPFFVCCDTLALCGGKLYGCISRTFHRHSRTFQSFGGSWKDQVYALTPGDGAVASLYPPPVALLRRDDCSPALCEYGLGLVAHRGALFYVAQLFRWNGRSLCSPCNLPPVACGVWRLDDDQQTWVEVARLEVQEVDRLTRLRYQPEASTYVALNFFRDDFIRFCAYGLRELLCCSLVNVHYTDVDGSHRHVLVLLGFNLDTGEWELVHELHPRMGEEVVMSPAVDLRPDLFLS